MKVSEITNNDLVQIAVLTRALGAAQFNGISTKDLESVIKSLGYLTSLAKQVGLVYKHEQDRAPELAPAPTPVSVPAPSKKVKRK